MNYETPEKGIIFETPEKSTIRNLISRLEMYENKLVRQKELLTQTIGIVNKLHAVRQILRTKEKIRRIKKLLPGRKK